jgi:plasmid stabilization system protein ParE
MAAAYKLHQKAAIEYADAFEWYENEQKGLGKRFIDIVDKRVMQICANPEHFSFAFGEYRQATVEGFPFTIVYKFFPERQFVHISSIHHNRRSPRRKFRKEG